MVQIIKEITVDVAKKNLFQAIVAKQNDNNSRFLKVTFVNEGNKVEIGNNVTAIINAARADGEARSFAGTVNDDGTVTVPLTSWMLELDDVVTCDISIIGGDGSKLTSTSFSLEVEAASCLGGDITEDENYDLLISLVASCTKSKEETELATAKAISATDSATEAARNAVTATENAVKATTEAREISEFYGAPLTAYNSSDMVQNNRIYVYCGDEEGFVKGNWYYYDTDSELWISGGVYNSTVTDELIIKDENDVRYRLAFALKNGKPIIEYDTV